MSHYFLFMSWHYGGNRPVDIVLKVNNITDVNITEVGQSIILEMDTTIQFIVNKTDNTTEVGLEFFAEKLKANITLKSDGRNISIHLNGATVYDVDTIVNKCSWTPF